MIDELNALGIEGDVNGDADGIWIDARSCINQIQRLRAENERLKYVMAYTAGKLETEESTPAKEADRLRGTLSGFQAPPVDLSFLDDEADQ